MADAQPQHGELVVSKAPKDIYSLTEKCRGLFSTYHQMSIHQTPYKWMMVIYEISFLLWANTSRCLDDRVKFFPGMKELFMSMLSVLQESLEGGEYHRISRIDHCFLTESCQPLFTTHSPRQRY